MAVKKNQYDFNYNGSDTSQQQAQQTQQQPTYKYDVNAAPKAPQYYDNSGSNVNGVSQGTMDRMNTKFQTSTNYDNAMAYTQDLLSKLNSGKTSYSDKLNSLIDDYTNKGKFNYNADKDTLWQGYLGSAMANGNTAMQDSMGQAAALTGGYGSSYSQQVGQSAYNKYLDDAYAKLPEFYNMAQNAYNQEDQRQLNNINLLNTQDSNEYSRNQNAYTANAQNAQNMYSQEYNQYLNDVQNAQNMASMQNSDWWNQTNYDWNKQRADVQDNQWQKDFDFNQDRANVQDSQWNQQFDYQKGRDAVADSQWDKTYNLQQISAANSAKSASSKATQEDYSVLRKSGSYNVCKDALANKYNGNEKAYNYLEQAVENGSLGEDEAYFIMQDLGIMSPSQSAAVGASIVGNNNNLGSRRIDMLR